MKKIIYSLALTFGFAATSAAQLQSLNVGDVAPDFTVTTLEGETFHLADQVGKYVIVDFFMYWCGPCAQISPILNSFYTKYGCNGYDIQVVSIEGEGTEAQTQAFETANGGDPNHQTPTASGLSGGGAAVHTSYHPTAYPTIIIIGPDGKILNKDLWPAGSVSAFENAVTAVGGGSALVVNSCESALGLAEIALTETSVYPNPTTGKTSVSFEANNAQDVTITVVSLSGQVLSSTVKAIEGGKNTIDLDISSLLNGTYLVTIKSANGSTSTVQVVKN